MTAGSSNLHKELEQLKRLADLMDSRFVLPGTSFRFGLDSILGLIPGVGDTVGAAFTGYIIYQGRKFQLPTHIKLRMLWNLFVDWLIGLIPLVGDIFDAGWKANKKNMQLLLRHLERNPHLMPEAPPGTEPVDVTPSPVSRPV